MDVVAADVIAQQRFGQFFCHAFGERGHQLSLIHSYALTEREYSPAETKFSLWAPTAEEVRVLLFESGNEGSASNTFPMEMGENGTWNISIKMCIRERSYFTFKTGRYHEN